MKKILFICPSQKPGYCGVGDYTRRLAVACYELGVSVGVVSLNEGPGDFLEYSEDQGIPCWRLSSEMAWGERTVEVEKVVGQFCPDWVSVQFVPYGYHPHGLCWELIKLLRRAVREPRKHVFFHELFLGLQREETIKNRIVGAGQRQIICKLLKDWKPDCVHSHAEPYVAWLSRQYPRAKRLPLVGNIPVLAADGPVTPEFDAWVAERDANPDTVLLGGYFGSFYPDGADLKFVACLHRFASETGRRIVCFLAGRQSDDALLRWQGLEAGADETVSWVHLGSLEPAAVSHYLRALNFGIAATPWSLAGKSGGIAAMREHGLPVLIPRNDWTPRFAVNEVPQAGLIPAWREETLTSALLRPQRSWLEDPAKGLARQFLDDLNLTSDSRFP